MNDDLLPLQDFMLRLVRQSWAYNNLTGQDAAPLAWTPVLTCATPGNLSVAYTTQKATVTKVGISIF